MWIDHIFVVIFFTLGALANGSQDVGRQIPFTASTDLRQIAMSNVIKSVLDGTLPAKSMSVSWWARGGEPGPGYTSDKLELSIVLTTGQAVGKYIRARFDQSYDPPFLAEEFSSQIAAEDWRQLLRALDDEATFSRQFPSETRANVADVVKETISVHADGSSQEKTLYGPAEDELGTSRAIFREIAEKVVRNGSRTVRSKKIS